jgi:hypothetical protein
MAGIIGNDLAIAFHRIQPARQHRLGVGPYFERLRDCAQIERRLGAAEDAENFLPAGNGVGSLVQKYFCSCYDSIQRKSGLANSSGAYICLDDRRSVLGNALID